MKLDTENLTIAEVMDICEIYGSLETYLAYPEDFYPPKRTYMERIIKRNQRDEIYTEEDLRTIREANKLKGILACLQLGLLSSESHVQEVLIEYGLDPENAFKSDEELGRSSRTR